MFLSNTRRGNWFSSSDCQIYSGVAPLTLVKLLLICLSTGCFALKEFAIALVTLQTSERKSSRAGKESELAVKWGVSSLLGEILALLNSHGIFPRAAFRSISCVVTTGLTSRWKERIPVSAGFDGFSAVPVCLRPWLWHMNLLADFTLIWRSHSSHKIRSSIKPHKDRHPAISEETR